MKKIILGVAVSLDSLIEGPNGEYDWCFADQDYGMSKFFKRVDTVFLGRKSYELMQSMPESEVPGMPKMKEYVFSNTLEEVKPGSTIIRGDIGPQVMEIKKREGKDIWLFGGASLTTSLIDLGLVDEFWLSVHPIILGAGKPMFQHLQERTLLELIESKTYSTGLVSLRYKLKQL